MPLKYEGMMEKIDIKDASIAEAVRKQMAVATPSLNGLMPNYYAPYDNMGEYNYDLNDIKKESRLLVSSTVPNSPTNEWGICLVFRIGSGYTLQWFIEYFGCNASYIRSFNTNKWSAWKKIW